MTQARDGTTNGVAQKNSECEAKTDRHAHRCPSDGFEGRATVQISMLPFQGFALRKPQEPRNYRSNHHQEPQRDDRHNQDSSHRLPPHAFSIASSSLCLFAPESGARPAVPRAAFASFAMGHAGQSFPGAAAPGPGPEMDVRFTAHLWKKIWWLNIGPFRTESCDRDHYGV